MPLYLYTKLVVMNNRIEAYFKNKEHLSNLIEPVLLVEDMNNPLYGDISHIGIPIVS